MACRTYQAFLENLADKAEVAVYGYDVRGTGESRLPVAPAYENGKAGIGAFLAQDLRQLFWALRDYVSSSDTNASPSNWILMGHSLGSWLTIHAGIFAHVRRVILLDPPLFQPTDAAKWALACTLSKRGLHPLSVMTRKRKRNFRNAEQAAWVFSKFEFFKGWPKDRIHDYIRSNYRSYQHGIALRHNPGWEGDIVESQPASAAMALLNLPKEPRQGTTLQCIFGSESPFCNLTGQLLLRSAFKNSAIHRVPHAGHMLVFQQQRAVVDLLAHQVLTDTFLSLPEPSNQYRGVVS
jgi:pimeloyl-ACP methyl ester carboxylesterase